MMRAKLAGIFPSMLICACLHGALAVAAETEASERPTIPSEQDASVFGKFFGVSADEMTSRMRQIPWAFYGRMKTRTQELVVASNTPEIASPDVYVTRFINGETLQEFALDDSHEKHLSVVASGLEFYENLSADKTPKPYSEHSKREFAFLPQTVATPLSIISQAFPAGPRGIHDGETETTFPYQLTWGAGEEVMAKLVARRVNSHLIVISIEVPSKNVAYSAEVEWDSELSEPLPDSMSLVDWRLQSGKSFATLGEARSAKNSRVKRKQLRFNSNAVPMAPPCLLFLRETPARATGRGTARSRGSRAAAR
jgi:hypothetical protein